MKINMIKKIVLYSITAMILTSVPAMAAGPLEPPAAPTEAGSAVYGAEAIYNRLQSGAAGAKRTGAFTEPTAGPGAVGRSLDEIMGLAPTADNTNGAAPANVTNGKTFWGLRTDGSWGPKTGTAYPAPVPKSGQTTCYDDSGTVITCAGTGQDGAKLKGVALPSPRFTDNSNGTVTDNLTGLIWLKNANCATVSSPKAWTAAMTAVASLKSGDCGLSDGSVAGEWRVPNRRELFSLVNDEYYSPALSNNAGTEKWTEGNPFSGVQSNNYWSSTTDAYYPYNAWRVDLNYGIVSFGNKATSYYVWPVRGGQ